MKGEMSVVSGCVFMSLCLICRVVGSDECGTGVVNCLLNAVAI